MSFVLLTYNLYCITSFLEASDTFMYIFNTSICAKEFVLL
jgi:hypothetical protein